MTSNWQISLLAVAWCSIGTLLFFRAIRHPEGESIYSSVLKNRGPFVIAVWFVCCLLLWPIGILFGLRNMFSPVRIGKVPVSVPPENFRVPVARCILCSHEVESTEGLNACPKCGTRKKPLDPSLDVILSINYHELRILAMWAERWVIAMKNENEQADCAKTLRSIASRINPQLRPDLLNDFPLFLSDEIENLRKAYGKDNVRTNFPEI